MTARGRATMLASPRRFLCWTWLPRVPAAPPARMGRCLMTVRNAVDTAAVMHWISFLILTVFFVESICRIIVIGLGDYIENKLEVFDGAVIILSFAPMVASTVANGPHSPWDGLSLIISLRVWRFKQIIDEDDSCEMGLSPRAGPNASA
ncbi:transmembrane protein 266-like [Lampetra planeri]